MMYNPSRINKIYFVKNLRKKAESLLNKGADVNEILRNISSDSNFSFILSSESELDSLELLGRVHTFEGNHKCHSVGDHEFLQDRIAYEVKTITWDTNVMRDIWRKSTFLRRKYVRRGYYTQIIYGEKPIIIPQQLAGGGTIRGIGEIMISTLPSQPPLVKKVKHEIHEASGELKRGGYKGRKVAIIDVRRIPYDLGYITERIKRYLEITSLNGALLLVYDTFVGVPINRFFIIPNKKSSDPISPADYEEVRARYPVTSEWVYEMPMIVHYNKTGVHSLIRREKNGFLLDGDIEIGRSLTANDTIMLLGAIASKKTDWMSIIKGKEKVKIHFR